MCHATTVLAAVVAQLLRAPHVRICFALDLDFLGFVVCPERAVAAADGAEALVGGFAERREGYADGLAVAGYLQAGLLGGCHCGRMRRRLDRCDSDASCSSTGVRTEGLRIGVSSGISSVAAKVRTEKTSSSLLVYLFHRTKAVPVRSLRAVERVEAGSNRDPACCCLLLIVQHY
jgi:hypothetical protein